MSISLRIADTADGTSRTYVWQYDQNQRIYIDGAILSEDNTTVLTPEYLIFSARGLDVSYQVPTSVDDDGAAYATIPNIVLADGTKLLVYAYDITPNEADENEAQTQEVIAYAAFTVKRRNELVEVEVTAQDIYEMNQILADCRASLAAVEQMEEDLDSYVGETTDTTTATLMGKLNVHTEDKKTVLDTYVGADETSGLKKDLEDFKDEKKGNLDSYVGEDTDTGTTTLKGKLYNYTEGRKDVLDSYVGSPTDSTESGTIMGDLNARLVELESALEEKETSLEGDLDTYEASKESELDSYTTTKKSELDTYETAKEGELDSYTTSLKSDLDSYEATKESEIDTYVTGTAEPAIDSYVENTTKPAIDTYRTGTVEPALDTYRTNTVQPAIDSYVDNTSKATLDDYVGETTDSGNTTLMGQLNAKKDEITSVYSSDLALKVNTADIVDDLTTEDATKPLSANQGKVLNDALNALGLSVVNGCLCMTYTTV